MTENIIKIAVNGQVGNDTQVYYTWPDAFDPARFTARDEWLRNLYDPRDDVRGFTGNRFYTLSKTAAGNYYSVTVPNVHDARNGWLMLSFFTGRAILDSGHALLEAFAVLEQTLLNVTVTPNAAVVAQVAASLQAHLQEDKGQPFASTGMQKGCRPYTTMQEVETFFDWPNQADYEKFRRILLVPSNGAPMTLPQGFSPVTSPIKKGFTVYATTAGVEFSKAYVEQGDMLTITYRRPGFLPEVSQVVVNEQPSSFVAYEGRRLRILAPEEAGIKFSRGIKFKCLDGKKPITAIWIEMDGAQLHKRGDWYILPATQDTYNLTVCARGYSKKPLLLTAMQAANRTVQVSLSKAPKPKPQGGEKKKKKNWLWVTLLVCLVMAAGGYLVAAEELYLWPFAEEAPKEDPNEPKVMKETPPQTKQPATEQPATEQPAPEQPASNDEQNDDKLHGDPMAPAPGKDDLDEPVTNTPAKHNNAKKDDKPTENRATPSTSQAPKNRDAADSKTSPSNKSGKPNTKANTEPAKTPTATGKTQAKEKETPAARESSE